MVTAVRACEVAADPTKALALEAASRRTRTRETTVRLAAVQRVVRAQFPAGFFPHFGLLGLVLWLGGLHRELAYDAVVADLGAGQGEAVVDFQRGAGGVTGVGLGESIVDALRAERVQSAGAASGFTPDRSWRVTRIAASAMISASRLITAETRKPCGNPVARAWFCIWVCVAAVSG